MRFYCADRTVEKWITYEINNTVGNLKSKENRGKIPDFRLFESRKSPSAKYEITIGEKRRFFPYLLFYLLVELRRLEARTVSTVSSNVGNIRKPLGSAVRVCVCVVYIRSLLCASFPDHYRVRVIGTPYCQFALSHTYIPRIVAIDNITAARRLEKYPEECPIDKFTQ